MTRTTFVIATNVGTLRGDADDLMMRERSEVVCDLPLGSDSSKVRSGEVGAHRVELSERLVTDLEATWGETVTADVGIPSYETLLEMLATGR